MPELTDILTTLRKMEAAGESAPALLEKIERLYEASAPYFYYNQDFLRQRNQFRVRHAGCMRIKRPKLLFGRRPMERLNYQSMPAVQNADVVFLFHTNLRQNAPAADTLSVDPTQECFDDVLAKLPAHFMPDLYFDYQVCVSPTFVRGMEHAPFPTAASLCHMFMARKNEQVAKLFDYVLPLSAALSDLLKQSVDPAKVIDLPFGLSWASFYPLISHDAAAARDIDVLLSFRRDQPGAEYGALRQETWRLFEEAQRRWAGRYKFVYAVGLDKETYIDLLGRSRIVLNAVGLHGPYNYRTCEAVDCGAALMQFQDRYVTGPQRMEDILLPDREYVPFTPGDFHDKLDRLLTDEPLRAKIAAAGQARMHRDYTYEALYKRFFDEAFSDRRAGWQARRLPAGEGALVRLYAYQNAPSTAQVDMSTLIVPERDVFDAIASGKTAVILPMYERLEPTLRRKAYCALVEGGDYADDCAGRLSFYDAAFAKLTSPCPIDRFNYLVLCAQNGRCAQDGLSALIAQLLRPDWRATDDEAMRLYNRPSVEGVSPQLAQYAEVAILNVPRLLTADAAARQKALCDYMLLWLYAIQSRGGTDAGAAQRVAEIAAAYPVERPSAVQSSLEIPAEPEV